MQTLEMPLKKAADSPMMIDCISHFSLMSSYCIEKREYFLPTSELPLCFSVEYECLLFCPEVNIHDDGKIGRSMADSKFQKIFQELQFVRCLYTDGSRMGGFFADFAVNLFPVDFM